MSSREIPEPRTRPSSVALGFADRPAGKPVLACPGSLGPAQSGGLPEPPFGDEKLRGLSEEQLDELYKKYRKSNPEEAEKVKRWQKSRGFRRSSVKKGSKAKKFLRKGGKVLKILVPIIFISDWIDGGFAHAAEEAANGALWPLSELWTNDEE